MQTYDSIIIGGGPAGVSAGIYLLRAGMNILVFDNNKSVLSEARKIDNYYGVKSISGEELKQKGIEQLMELGCEVKNGEVVSVRQDFSNNSFIVNSTKGTYSSKTIIICTGVKKKKTLPAFEKYEGNNISYCAVCDGFFYRGKTVAVIGDGEFALNESKYLSNIASSVYLLTNGKSNLKNTHKNIEIIQENIESVEGEDKVERIILKNKNKLEVDGVFIALGNLSSFELSKQLGIVTKNENILVDKTFMTNVAGVFAAGDVIGGLLQVVKAVSDGAQAGLEAARYVKILEYNEKK